MMKKFIVYILKAIFLFVSWFIIVYGCSGDINEVLFCISIFTYSGSVVFDCIFYMFNAHESNTVLRNWIIVLAAIALLANLLVTFTSLVCNPFIVIDFNIELKQYIIALINNSNNGIINLYPEVSNWYIELPEVMIYIIIFAIFSLLPAILLEVDSYIRIRNDRNKNPDESRVEK